MKGNRLKQLNKTLLFMKAKRKTVILPCEVTKKKHFLKALFTMYNGKR